MKKKHFSASAEETQAIAQSLALRIEGGGVIALTGELGAGKTVFVKGLARGLGIIEIIQSPTFVLMKVYQVQHKTLDVFVHIDCYRLASIRELL
ncbi:MAG: tRNA (adenosine(37)-N6)-threonylcarbamoyltransferase complex ATPase subunit type 1 TsaE, partial [Patescibacteria group bacterium]